MTQEIKEESPWIPCEVSRGLFSNERGVYVELPDGKVVSTFVDKSKVLYSGDIGSQGSVSGHLTVRVVEIKPESVWIDIPGQDSVTGSRFEVPKSYLQGYVANRK